MELNQPWMQDETSLFKELSDHELSKVVGGLQVEFDIYNPYSPSSSGQSTTVGGSVNQFSNTNSSGSNVVGGFVTQGIIGTQYTNNQVSVGGSSTNTNS